MNARPEPPTPAMLVSGLNHVAIVTADLERLATFYRDVFDATIVDVPAPPGSRAALVRLGATAAIAVLEVPDSPSIVPDGEELRRGHLDHIAFDTATASQLDTIRARLVEREASDGTVNDYGAMLSVNFIDPDGMSTEVCWLRDPTLADLHPPVPLAGALSLLDADGRPPFEMMGTGPMWPLACTRSLH